MTANLLPSELLALLRDGDLCPQTSVAADTETSGLFADDGARVSTVSVAWEDDEAGSWAAFSDRGTYDIYKYATGEKGDFGAAIFSIAWPFDQGLNGKPEDNGQDTLFGGDQDNLDLEEWRCLLDWLRLVGGRVGITWHNAKFDLEKMRVGCRRWPGVGVELEEETVWDTQNVNHLLWPLLPHPDSKKPTTSLKPSTAVLFDEPSTQDEATLVKKYLKSNRLPSGRWDLMPWDVIGAYATGDATLTKRLELRQIHDIEAGLAGDWLGTPEDVAQKVARRLEVTKLLYRMEKKGLPYDEVGSREAADACRERARKIGEELPFKPTLPKAKQYFFGEGKTERGFTCLGLTPYSVTTTGDASMTAEILVRMVNDDVPHADLWANYQKASNAASMWYEAYAEAMGTDLRLRTCFRQNGTRSSRFSVERVNLQAIPQDYRLTEFSVLEGIPTPRQLIASAVEAMPGWTLWELDLAQAELRVAAMFANCGPMMEMIENDQDLHTFTTLALFPEVSEDDPLFKSMWRQVGKRGNFSLLFGAQGPTFARMVSKEVGIQLPGHEADRIVKDWNALYPQFEQAIHRHSNVVAVRQSKFNKGWLDLLNGERRWFERYEETSKSFNQRVQGNLAQFGIDWLLESDSYLRAQGLDGLNAGLLLCIHDSQVLLLPDSEGEVMAKKCADIGEQLWGKWFPHVPGGVDLKKW